MQKTMSFLFLFGLFSFVNMLNAEEQSSVTASSEALFSSIWDRALVENKCKLTKQEAMDAFRFELKNKKITVESFQKTTEMMEKLVEALRQVVVAKKEPDAVYQGMNLSQYGITAGNWKFYINNYKDEARIKKLEEYIPNNMNIIVESGYKSFSILLEQWLLEQVIINSFEKERESSDKNIKYSDKEKKVIWWDNYLKKEIKDPKQRNIWAEYLATKKCSPFSDAESILWKEYFAGKK